MVTAQKNADHTRFYELMSKVATKFCVRPFISGAFRTSSFDMSHLEPFEFVVRQQNSVQKVL